MRNKDRIRVLFFILLVLWMGVIFFFSAKPAENSTKMSLAVGGVIGKLLIPEFEEWNEKEQDAFAEKIDFVVRKSAHACEYAVLGILFFINYQCRIRSIKRIAGMSILSVILYAVTDELHQLFVPGRSGQIADVILDSGGGVGGVVLSVLLLYIIRKRKKYGS